MIDWNYWIWNHDCFRSCVRLHTLLVGRRRRIHLNYRPEVAIEKNKLKYFKEGHYSKLPLIDCSHSRHPRPGGTSILFDFSVAFPTCHTHHAASIFLGAADHFLFSTF
jgi:hypothetical protein